MKKRKNWAIVALAAVAGVGSIAQRAHAASFTWNGSNDPWDTAADWGGTLPNTGDTGYISSGMPVATISLSGNPTVEVDTGATLSLKGGNTISTLITLSGGTVYEQYTGDGQNFDSNINVSANSYMSAGYGFTENGSLSGAGNITFSDQNSDPMDLAGNNSGWSGNTIITSGALVQDGSATGNGLGTGQVVLQGGTLSFFYNNNYTVANTIIGTGTVATAYNKGVNITGTLSPGATPGAVGKITFGPDPQNSTWTNLTFGSGATFVADLNSASSYDQLVWDDTAPSLTNLALSASLNYIPSNSDILFIGLDEGGGSIGGTFTGLANGATVTLGTYTALISYDASQAEDSITGGNDIALYDFTMVPEPTSMALVGVAGLGLLSRRRNKKRAGE